MSSERRDKRTPAQIVFLARRWIARIQSWTEGLTIDAYEADEKTRYAVERGFIALGEAIKDLARGVNLAGLDPAGPWSHPARMRDFMAHEYDDQILPAIVWETIEKGLPELDKARARIEPILGGPWTPPEEV